MQIVPRNRQSKSTQAIFAAENIEETDRAHLRHQRETPTAPRKSRKERKVVTRGMGENLVSRRKYSVAEDNPYLKGDMSEEEYQ